MHHDKQVWVLIEDTRRDRTGVLVPVRVLLGDVGSRKSTMLDLNIFIYIYIYIIWKICYLLRRFISHFLKSDSLIFVSFGICISGPANR